MTKSAESILSINQPMTSSLGTMSNNYLEQRIKGILHLLPPKVPKKVPKLACFVLYLKIISIFLKNNICI